MTVEDRSMDRHTRLLGPQDHLIVRLWDHQRLTAFRSPRRLYEAIQRDIP